MANDVIAELGFADGVTNSAYKNSLTQSGSQDGDEKKESAGEEKKEGGDEKKEGGDDKKEGDGDDKGTPAKKGGKRPE